MKIKVIFVFIGLFISTLAFDSSLFYPLTSDTRSEHFFQFLSSSDDGVSKYNITNSVTYQVEFNFSLTHKIGPGNYKFIFARLNNRIPTSSLTKYCPPYQESKLLINNISGYIPSEIEIGHHDKFNNTYDSFNASLSPDEQVTLYQQYEAKLNEIKFQNISDTDIGEYNMADEIFTLYCNNTEPYYERDDPALIALSNSIVNFDDNPVEKALKIINWVSSYLVYNPSLPAQEMGALWAYNNGEGDVSEFSSLMITLLRIQNIPARKVTGFLVSNNPSFNPKINSTLHFYNNLTGATILGHAWVEYYVPDIGWISCDPTWYNGFDYFNRNDFLRFQLNVGANFFIPPSYFVSEFSNPIFVFLAGATFEYTFDIKLTIINTSLPLITINSPIKNRVFGKTSPDFNLSIIGSYTNIWYTIDNGMTNITSNGLTGTINQTEWGKKGNEMVTIKFYAKDSGVLVGDAEVQVVKLVNEEETPFLIPGYNLIALIGVILIMTKSIIKSVKKNKKSSNYFG